MIFINHVLETGIFPDDWTCTAFISTVYLWHTNLDAGKLNGSVFITLVEGKVKDS